ncbi:hypothetical protein EI025_28605, partial [Escherichia coli]|nr:hypothetical protein [Escherichia coli]
MYIGYSPGVDKTFEMLSNAIELFQSNVDIKIGYIEPHQRDETNALAEQLPKITTNFTKHGSHHFQYLDVDRIIEESPTIVLIDELAHTNISRDRH